MTTPDMATYGVTSMIAPLRRVLVRRPATSGDWAGAAWRTPDPQPLRAQHEAFCELSLKDDGGPTCLTQPLLRG